MKTRTVYRVPVIIFYDQLGESCEEIICFDAEKRKNKRWNVRRSFVQALEFYEYLHGERAPNDHRKIEYREMAP